MDASLFRAFQDLAYRQAGIRLSDAKRALLSARVGRRMRALKLPSERLYLEALSKDESGRELIHFLDAISTNFTNFFREPDHFALLERAASEWLAAGQRRFRLWCAASSSGEEPYTIAMVLNDVFAGQTIDLRILATDLSTKVLLQAKEGVYAERQLEPVPSPLRRRFFEPAGDTRLDGRLFTVRPILRERILFKRLNLSQPPFPLKGPLDAIFCRNVMIYLAQPVRQAFVREAERLLRPGGLLFVGHAETLTGVPTGLKMLKPSVYRKAGGR
ncbi:MAG: CheR family methyltransferase [Myxococcales bacterium]